MNFILSNHANLKNNEIVLDRNIIISGTLRTNNYYDIIKKGILLYTINDKIIIFIKNVHTYKNLIDFILSIIEKVCVMNIYLTDEFSRFLICEEYISVLEIIARDYNIKNIEKMTKNEIIDSTQKNIFETVRGNLIYMNNTNIVKFNNISFVNYDKIKEIFSYS